MTPAEAAKLSSRRSAFRLVDPRLELQDEIKRSALVERAIAAVDQVVYHQRSAAPDCLRQRQQGRRTKVKRNNPTTVARLHPSRAHAMARVLKWMLPRGDIKTGDVWITKWNTRERPTRKQIMDGAGLDSWDRFEHALSDQVSGDIVYRRQERKHEKRPDGEKWSGFVAVTKLLPRLWFLLGLQAERAEFLALRLELEAERQRRQLEAQQAAANAATVAAAVHTDPVPGVFDHLNREQLRKAQGRAFALQADNPGWTHDQCNEQALIDLGLPPRPTPPPDDGPPA